MSEQEIKLKEEVSTWPTKTLSNAYREEKKRRVYSYVGSDGGNVTYPSNEIHYENPTKFGILKNELEKRNRK